jgi:acetyltransferase-like isoleucine patch superfamily enzyme
MYQFIHHLKWLSKRYAIKRYLHSKNTDLGGIPTFSGAWPVINNDGKISIGEHCTFNSFRLRQHITVTENAELVIGNYVFLNDGVNICSTQSIRIGNNTKIGDMTYIYDTDFHEISPEIPTKKLPVSIGNNVWIGANSMILPGSVIGDHCVIAAGSIVTSEIPAKSLAAGTPARVIKMLDIPEGWIRD